MNQLAASREKFFQTTIARDIEIQGQGLHKGENVVLKFKPAQDGEGIFFVRTDLENKPKIPAHYSSIQEMERNTLLVSQGVTIFTVEHVLSAVYALGIDNLCIEINNIEPPVFDGSSSYFFEILQPLIVSLSSKKKMYSLKSPVYYEDADSVVIALPSSVYQVSCTICYPLSTYIGTQTFRFAHKDPSHYYQEISKARTFCLEKEVEYLKSRGLIKGGSLNNAVVIRGKEILNENGLRYVDEMVRHKILDVIGDLSLVGKYFLAHIVAINPGHVVNGRFAKLLDQALQEENIHG